MYAFPLGHYPSNPSSGVIPPPTPPGASAGPIQGVRVPTFTHRTPYARIEKKMKLEIPYRLQTLASIIDSKIDRSLFFRSLRLSVADPHRCSPRPFLPSKSPAGSVSLGTFPGRLWREERTFRDGSLQQIPCGFVPSFDRFDPGFAFGFCHGFPFDLPRVAAPEEPRPVAIRRTPDAALNLPHVDAA